MQTSRIIGTVLCVLALSACNDVSRSGSEVAESRNTAPLAPRHETTQDTLPDAVPVPPASASAVITGSADAPAASAETPVTSDAKADASTAASATPDTSAPSSTGSEASSGASAGSDEPRAATDSSAANPLGTLTRDDEVKSMPLAGQGNNHSSPSLEQGEKK